jgi:hypothetical protein
VGPVSQNRIVSTTRLTEVLSDPTNALAVEAAARRRQDSRGEVHLAAAHRVLRAQPFPPGFSSHFPLFAVASSARDTGSGETESRLLLAQVRFWRAVLMELLPAATPQISVTFFDGGAVRERFLDTGIRALEADGRPSLVLEDPDRQRARGYYRGAALRITAAEGRSRVELGDGGLTDWTAQLTGNAKERCCISCISIERLADLSGAT